MDALKTTEFLRHLSGLGVLFAAHGDRLRCTGPRELFTAELRREIASRKHDILLLLEAEPPLTVQAVARDGSLPLAVPQERLWFLQQLDPGSSAYNVAFAVRLSGALQREPFQHAWTALASRHESLRTVFPVLDARPVQRILPESEVPILDVDLTDMPVGEREVLALSRATEEAERPFDLDRGPLIRVTVLRLATNEHLVAVAIHHLVCDQWSLGVLSAEFAELYRALVEGRSPRLAELTVQYGDYALCHRRWAEPVVRRQLSYWKQQLAGLRLAELPTDRLRIGFKTGPGASGVLSLSPQLIERLREVGRTQRATLFMVFLAAFKALMTRYTDSRDIVVGTPIAGRTVPEVEGLVGTFVNTLVFRTDLSGDPTFRELIGRVRSVAVDAYANQDVHVDRLINELQLQTGANRSQFFQVLFNVQNAPLELNGLPNLSLEVVPLPRRSTQFDLALSIDADVQKCITYTYDTALFDRSTMERLFGQFHRVLQSVSKDPDVRLSELDAVDPVERTTVLTQWNATHRVYPHAETVVSMFERRATLTPDAIAVTAGSECFTFAALDERATRLAHHLQTVGAGPDRLIGIFLNRSVEIVVALLGVLKTGAAYLPLDPGFPQQRLGFMLRDSGASLLVTEASLSALLPACGLPVVQLDAEAEPFSQVSSRSPSRRPSPDDPAYVIYTSGSSGEPKGVEVTHRSLTNFLCSMQREPGLASTDRVLSVTTLSFDIAGLELFLPLITGARLVIASREQAADPRQLGALIAKNDVTMMQATPATWRMLLEHGWPGDPGLTILCGGETLPRHLANELLSRSRAVWNMYGPTETTIWSTIERVSPGEGPVSIGRPIANTQVYVLDSQRRPTPIGVPGELFIGGDGVARGYVRRPALTAERFVVDEFSGRPGARLYRTGDLARFRTDGRLEYLGRVDDQVKLRGFRIELGEVEAALSALEGVQQAVAAVTSGPGEPRLVAYYTKAAAGSPVDPAALRAHLAGRLPAYMVPDFLVELDALPLTPNGKIDRRALPAGQPLIRTSGGAPRSHTEAVLSQIWAEVLGLSAVGVDEDFFELGGHSLLAVRLMSRLDARFQTKPPLAALFEARTVRRLAQAIADQRHQRQWTALVRLQPEGRRPPFFCVHGIGGEVLAYSALARHLAPDQPFMAFRTPDDGAGSAPTTIEERASLYVRELIAFDPIGPYYLGGYSFGGRVALEMALQLEATNRRVAFLGIIDASPCDVRDRSFLAFARFVENVPRWVWHDGRRSSLDENLDRLSRARRILMKWARSSVPWADRQLRQRARRPDVRDVINIDALAEHVQRTFVLNHEAAVRYQPTRRCGAVTLFRSLGQPLFGQHAPDLGWRRVSRGPVTVRHIAGNHSSILREPDVQLLADQLRIELGQAQLAAEDNDQR